MQTHKDWMNLIIFRQARDIFAVPVEPIQQIIEMTTVIPISLNNIDVEGVINYHEILVPVINLSANRCLPDCTARRNSPILLINIQNRLAGLLADEVQKIISIPTVEIITTKELPTKDDPKPIIVQGWVKVQDRTAILLDLDHLLIPYQAILVNAYLNKSDSASRPDEK